MTTCPLCEQPVTDECTRIGVRDLNPDPRATERTFWSRTFEFHLHPACWQWLSEEERSGKLKEWTHE